MKSETLAARRGAVNRYALGGAGMVDPGDLFRASTGSQQQVMMQILNSMKNLEPQSRMKSSRCFRSRLRSHLRIRHLKD
jgi:hypothetical protein